MNTSTNIANSKNAQKNNWEYETTDKNAKEY